jgi:hypothetical protein
MKMTNLTHEQKLLAAIKAFEDLGNTVEEFGSLLWEAKQIGFDQKTCESRNNARQNIRKLPHGEDILAVEIKR